jgi:hypothetical protein
MTDKEKIQKLLDEELTFWTPQEGESIIGLLKEKREGIGQFGSNLYIIDVDGKLIGVWGNAAIDNNLKDVPVGSQIGLKYIGKAISDKTKREYKNFRIVVEPLEP